MASLSRLVERVRSSTSIGVIMYSFVATKFELNT